jgi:hypothetical protein
VVRPAIGLERVAASFTERLVPKFPRFAQRVLEPPVTIGLIGPRWQDVAAFDVDSHLHRFTLPRRVTTRNCMPTSASRLDAR